MGPTFTTFPLLYVVFLLFPTFLENVPLIYLYFFTLKYHLNDTNTEFFLARFARSDFRNKLLHFFRE